MTFCVMIFVQKSQTKHNVDDYKRMMKLRQDIILRRLQYSIIEQF